MSLSMNDSTIGEGSFEESVSKENASDLLSAIQNSGSKSEGGVEGSRSVDSRSESKVSFAEGSKPKGGGGDQSQSMESATSGRSLAESGGGSYASSGGSASSASGRSGLTAAESSIEADSEDTAETAETDYTCETAEQRKKRLWTPLGRRVAVWKNNVDLIIAARHPKWVIELPNVPVESGARLRHAQIPEEELIQILIQIKEGEYNKYTARPDVELWLVGAGAPSQDAKQAKAVLKEGTIFGKMSAEAIERQEGGAAAKQKAIDKAKAKLAKATNASSKKDAKAAIDRAGTAATKDIRGKLLKDCPNDVTEGKGVEVLFDAGRQVFFTTQRMEDDLVTLARNAYEKAFVVNSVTTFYGRNDLMFMNAQTQRLWRRFMRQVVDPCLDDDEHLLEIRERRRLLEKVYLEKNTLKAADKVEYALTDSDEEEAAEKKRERERGRIRAKEEARKEKEARKAAAAADEAARAKKAGTPANSRPGTKQTDVRPTSVT